MVSKPSEWWVLKQTLWLLKEGKQSIPFLPSLILKSGQRISTWTTLVQGPELFPLINRMLSKGVCMSLSVVDLLLIYQDHILLQEFLLKGK